ncbi:hypothetical protein [Aquiflexum gelatinilyticum]|uniref:hypothetical protein n=1 Tax=Aquiflexum gelatinilyticum TaxID=2961943 RepID=UPI002169C586|nr:hypothetical protein [Aquiflexum gelatinilyticum]MCS4434659.1 hypothetical protein [Aquiflexum gelatinilyticum]
MKKPSKKEPKHNNGILSKLNDNPDQKEKTENSDRKKGIIGEMNDEPEMKKPKELSVQKNLSNLQIKN